MLSVCFGEDRRGSTSQIARKADQNESFPTRVAEINSQSLVGPVTAAGRIPKERNEQLPVVFRVSGQGDRVPQSLCWAALYTLRAGGVGSTLERRMAQVTTIRQRVDEVVGSFTYFQV